MTRWGNENDGAAARRRRNLVAEEIGFGAEDSRRSRSTDKLVRRNEHGVLVIKLSELVVDVWIAIHVDFHVAEASKREKKEKKKKEKKRF